MMSKHRMLYPLKTPTWNGSASFLFLLRHQLKLQPLIIVMIPVTIGARFL